MSRLLDSYHKATEAREQRLRASDTPPPAPRTPHPIEAAPAPGSNVGDRIPPAARTGSVRITHRKDQSETTPDIDAIRMTEEFPARPQAIDDGIDPPPSPFRQRAVTAGLLLLTVAVATVGSWPYRGYLAKWLIPPDATTQSVEEGRLQAPDKASGIDSLAILPATAAGSPGAVHDADSPLVPASGPIHPQPQATHSSHVGGGSAPQDRPVTPPPREGAQTPDGSAPRSASDSDRDQESPRRRTLAPGIAGAPWGGSRRGAQGVAGAITGGHAATPTGGAGSPSSSGAARPGNRAQALLSSGAPGSNIGPGGGPDLPAAGLSTPSSPGNGGAPTPAQALLTTPPAGRSPSDGDTGSAGTLLNDPMPLPEDPADPEQGLPRKTGAARDLLAGQGDLPIGPPGTDVDTQAPVPTGGIASPSAADLLNPASPTDANRNPVGAPEQATRETATPAETGGPPPSAQDLLTGSASSPPDPPQGDVNADTPPTMDSPTGSSLPGPASGGDASVSNLNPPDTSDLPDPGLPALTDRGGASSSPDNATPSSIRNPPTENGILPFGNPDTNAGTGDLPALSDGDTPMPQGPVPLSMSGHPETGIIDALPEPAEPPPQPVDAPSATATDTPLSASPQTDNTASPEQGMPGEPSPSGGGDAAPADTQSTGSPVAGNPSPGDTGDPGPEQGGPTSPSSSSTPYDGGNTQDTPGTVVDAPAPNSPAPVAMPTSSGSSGSAPEPGSTGSIGIQSSEESHPQTTDGQPTAGGDSTTYSSFLASLFPIGAQTPSASTRSDLSLAVDIDGALMLPNPYALFTTGADTRTKASADVTDGPISGHIADAINSAEILPGDIVAQGGTALSPKRIATMDFAGFTRAESLFDQPLGAWAESIGGAGVDRIAVVPLTSDASIDLSWDINHLAVETSPSNALSVMRHVAAVTQTPANGDTSQAITTLLGFSIISQNGHRTVTTYELPGSTAIGDWLAAAGDPNSANRPGPTVAVPLTDRFIDPLTRLPGTDVSLNVAQYEYSIEAPAVAVRPVAERTGAIDSGAMVRWDAAGKRLTFDPIPIEILSTDGQSKLAAQFRHDPLAGAHIEIDPLLYAGSLNGRNYFLGNEVRLLAGNGAVLFQGAIPTVVYDDSLYSESGFNLFSPLLSMAWQEGDGSSWMDQFVSRMDAQDLFMPELFIGFELPDSPIEDWLSNDFEASADVLLSFATSPAVNDSYSETSETLADTPAGALANLRTDYEPTASLEESDQIGTSGISLPEYDPWTQARTARVAARRASARRTASPAQAQALPALAKPISPQTEAVPIASASHDPGQPPAAERDVIEPMIAAFSRQLPTQALEPNPRAYARKLAPRTPLPKAARRASAPAVSSASTGLLLTVGMSILIVAGRRRRRVSARD